MNRRNHWIASALVLVALAAAGPVFAFPAGGARLGIEQDTQAASSSPESSSTGLVGVINVNEATEKQLSLLPGVGPSKAQAIVSYRSKRSFKDPRHLIRVRGIGRTTLKKILPFLTVKGPTTLKKK